MRTVDLFAGAGGLSLGFQQAGFDVAAAYDSWAPALECYRLNFEHPAYRIDLSDVDTSVEHIRQYRPDAVIGGPPCQDFSSAGKRQEGENANLTSSFISIVLDIMPQIMVMENVPRARNSLVYKNAKQTLLNNGYQVFQTVLDASRCGAPQIRKRFFAIAWKKRNEKFEAEMAIRLKDSLDEKQMTVRDYMNGEISIEHYYRHPRNYSRRGVFSICEPSPTIRGVNRPVPPNYVGHRLDTAPVDMVRPLTRLERSRIQTFPKDWKWSPSAPKTTTEQLIGNAVPVELARFVAQHIKEILL